MKKRYIILAIVFLGIAAGLLTLPATVEKTPVTPTELLMDIHSNNRFINSDQLAKRIIDGDPVLFLVDVRDKAEYDKYTLPGAINIPFDQLLNDDWRGYLNQNVNDIVFFSNDDVLAEQAWVLCKQLGFKHLYVLDGGLNYWFETIMQPKMPKATEPTEAFDLYTFREGASIYFGAGSVAVPVPAEPKPKPQVKKTIPVQKKVKASAEGGC